MAQKTQEIIERPYLAFEEKMAKGLDYAWHGTINWDCFWNSGVRFIMRYLSYDSSKDITSSELYAANQRGIAVGLVWETTADRMLSGYNGGVSDAKEANSRVNSLGIAGLPIYFACDWDATESQQPTINAYMDGVISVIGKSRTGIYAGYWPGKRTMDAGKATYLWQTYAWSGGNWDSRAQLRQIQNGVTVCGVSSDWDESMKTDYGQFPRPQSAPIPQPQEGNLMCATTAFDPRTGKQITAYIDQQGRVCCNGGIVDPDQSNAKSGAGLVINDSGLKVITYTNSAGKVCTYSQNPGSNEWGWASKEWNAQ